MDIFLFTDNGDICCVHILINTYRREKVKGKILFQRRLMSHRHGYHGTSVQCALGQHSSILTNAHLFNIHVKNVTQHLSTLTIMCFKCIILLKLHQIGVVSPVMWMLYWSAVYLSICVPALAYCHKLWVAMEGRRSQIGAAKMSFLQR